MRPLGIRFLALAAFIFLAARLSAWTEDTLNVTECSSCSGSNDSYPCNSCGYPIGGTPNLSNSGSALGTGTGYLSSNSDKDVYQFRITNSDLNIPSCLGILKIVLTPPSGKSYSMQVGRWSGSAWQSYTNSGGSSGVVTKFYDLSSASGNQDFYIGIEANDISSNPYTLSISMVAYGTISGTVTALGATGSGSSAMVMSAVASDGTMYTNDSGSSFSGVYNVHVPVGVTITSLVASRSYYNGAPGDWAYGPSRYTLPSALVLSSACQVASGKDFNAFPEATISGTLSGTLSSYFSVNLDDYYRGSSNNGYMDVSGSSYVMHNVEPGTWRYQVKNTDNSNNSLRETLWSNNVVVSDGLQVTQNLSFNGGSTMSGSISPVASGSGITVKVLEAGTSFMVGRADNCTSSYSISGVPSGHSYDVVVEANGPPSSYIPALNVSVGVHNIGSLASNGTISGIVNDPQNLGASNLIIVGYRTGDDPFGVTDNNRIPIVFTQPTGVSSPYTFSLPVDSAYSYHIGLLGNPNQSGFPPFYDSKANLANGASSITLSTSTTNHYTISGSYTLAGKALSTSGISLNRYPSVYSFGPSGNWSDGVDLSGDSYTTNALLTGATYALKSKVKYFSQGSLSVTLAGANATGKTLNLPVDAAQDDVKPFAWQLSPVNNRSVGTLSPSVHAVLSDGLFGTGINSGSIVAKIDNVVKTTTYYSSSGLLSVTAGTLTSGSHTVLITFSDLGSPANSSSVTWTFDCSVASPTVTPTQAASSTRTPTYTVTPPYTPTVTPTFSNSFTQSPSFTQSVTFSISPTHSPSFTQTPTATPSITGSATYTPTSTRTPSFTRSATASPTPSRTVTPTRSPTAPPFSPTQTPTFSASPTASNSFTITDTFSATPSATPSRSATPSVTSSATRSATPTVSPSRTVTPTRSPTAPPFSPTQTPTFSASPTVSPSFTITNTFTGTPSFSPSRSATPSATASATMTVSPTVTQTKTFSPSPTISETYSISPTFSESPTAVPFKESGQGKVILAPVPAELGSPVCMYFKSAPSQTKWEVFNVARDHVATLSFGSQASQCWTPTMVSPGLYYVHVQVTGVDGTKEESWVKLLLVK